MVSTEKQDLSRISDPNLPAQQQVETNVPQKLSDKAQQLMVLLLCEGCSSHSSVTRQEPLTFSCDIEGMFHQVHVNEEQCNFLHFHWWGHSMMTDSSQPRSARSNQAVHEKWFQIPQVHLQQQRSCGVHSHSIMCKGN